MAITQLVSVEEYLHSTFEHDAEYVAGRIVPRSTPRKPHSKMQFYLVRMFYQVAHPLGYEVSTDQRMRTQAAPARYRDLCVAQGESPDDAAVELWAKIREYLAFGVAYVWVVDPNTGQGEIHSPDGTERVENGGFRAGPIEVEMEEL